MTKGSNNQIGAAIVLFAISVVVGCQRVPQLGGNEECLGAADALWTAVTAQDTGLIDASDVRIKQLHTDAKLPDDAYEALASVIANTRAGDWDAARAELKEFARGQRPKQAP